MIADRKREKSGYREKLLAYLRSHISDNRLPAEREITEDLGISRYLVRKHLAAFEKEGLLVKKARQGIFTSPSLNTLPTYGIVFYSGEQNAYFASPEILAGAMKKLSGDDQALFRYINFRTPAQLPEKCRSLGLSGCLWLGLPKPKDIPSIRKVLEEYPNMVIVPSDQSTGTEKLLEYNFVMEDIRKNAHLRAAYFAAKGCRNILYYAVLNENFDFFSEGLAAYGIEMNTKCVIDDPHSLHKKLPSLIRKYHIDGILCDGANFFYENLFDYLSANRDFSPVLSLQNHGRLRHIMKDHPEIQVEFPFNSMAECNFKTGEKAGELLLRIIGEGKKLPGIRISTKELTPEGKAIFQNNHPSYPVREKLPEGAVMAGIA